jgi:hypothetical protein
MKTAPGRLSIVDEALYNSRRWAGQPGFACQGTGIATPRTYIKIPVWEVITKSNGQELVEILPYKLLLCAHILSAKNDEGRIISYRLENGCRKWLLKKQAVM